MEEHLAKSIESSKLALVNFLEAIEVQDSSIDNMLFLMFSINNYYSNKKCFFIDINFCILLQFYYPTPQRSHVKR